MSTMTRFEEIDAWITARELTRILGYPDDAKASAGELRCQLYVAKDLSDLSQEQFQQVFDLADKVSRQIYRFMSYLGTHRQSRRAPEESSEYEV